MNQGMISGNAEDAYRRKQTGISGAAGNRKTYKTKTKKTSSKSQQTERTNKRDSGRDGEGLYEEGVRYDVSNGRSRVAQILSQQQSLYSYEEDDFQTAAEKTSKTQTTKAGQTQAAAESGTEMDGADDQSENIDTQGYSVSDIEYMERLLERMRESQKNITKTKTTSKKAVTYNYRKVSGAIMRAKTRVQAGNALSSAKSELSSLKRKAGSGQYKDEELQMAINHVNKMIRTARKKMSHLKLEEMRKKGDQDTVKGRERKNQNIKKDKALQSNTPAKAELDRQVLELKKKLKQITKTEKNGHRRSENYELLQADMEYLKSKIQMMRQEQSGQGTDTSQQSEFGSAGTADNGAVTSNTSAVTAAVDIMVGGAEGNASAAELAQQGMSEM